MASMIGCFLGCTSDYDIFPGDMAKVLMFKDSGTQNVTVYSAQDQVPAQVVVLKGGVAPEQGVTATVRVMSQSEFNEYAANAGGIAVSYLPSNCYTLGEGDAVTVTFSGGEGYQTVDVNLDVKAIGAYLEAKPDSVLSPAIPLVLECSDAKVNESDDKVFLVPDYRIPKVGFTEGAVFSPVEENVLTATIELPFESQWDIPCQVEVDTAALAEYNATNGTGYQLMPPSAYSIGSTVNMPVGETSVDLEITADPAKAGFFDVIPLRLKSAGIEGIEVDDEADICLLGFDINGYLVPLTVSMLSTNAQEPTEGPISNLLDDDVNTFFHSAWSISVSGYHYLQITLPNACSRVAIEYTNRNSSTPNTPATFNFYVGTSEANLTLYKHFERNDGDPEKNFGADIRGGAAETNIIAPAAFASPKSVFRIENELSGNNTAYFCMSTLSVYAR